MAAPAETDSTAVVERIETESWKTIESTPIDPSWEGSSRLGLVGFSDPGMLIGLAGWRGEGGGSGFGEDCPTLAEMREDP